MKNINDWGTWALNFYGQFIFTALGLVALFFTIRILRRKLVADEQGVGFVGKERILWSDVTGLDATELKDKQILYVLHGSVGRYPLDGFNLRNFRELVDFVETHVPQPAATAPPADDAPDQTPPPADDASDQTPPGSPS